jgi:hypothetical protein
MFSRLDDLMFQAGAETLLNCIPRPTGAVTRRPGTRLIRETRENRAAHLFSFVFSQTQSVVIEGSRATIAGVEGGYFRFHINGGTLLYSQPKRYQHSLSLGATTSFRLCRTVQCNVASPMVVTLTDHGLREGDMVQFLSAARTVPGGFSAFTTYYVRIVDNNSFNLSATITGALLNSSSHSGYSPVLFNWTRWGTTSKDARQGIALSEHRIQNKEPVVVTMWPLSNNPKVTFYPATSSFFASAPFGQPGLARTPKVNQQVMFVADDPTKIGGTTAGAVLPSSIEEGRLYWVTGYNSQTFRWTISKTFEGPPLDMGTDAGKSTPSSSIRMCALPELDGGSRGAQGRFGCLERYYAIANANDPNILKLEASITAGQVAGGGFEFDAAAIGWGPFKIHRAHEVGDIASITDPAGGIRSFYSQKNWWNPDLPFDKDVMSLEAHDSPGSRTPGSTQRTDATQGAYWRELPGRTTGGAFAVSANEFTTGSEDLVLTSISGGHGFETGMAVAIVEGQMPVGILVDTVYYAIKVSTADIKLATTYANAIAGTAIDAPTSADPRSGGLLLEGFVDFDSAAQPDKVRWPSHGLSNGDTVVFSEDSDFVTHSAQIGITLGTVYYVRSAETDYFRISASAAGPLIDLTGSDGKLISAIGRSIYEVPHNYSDDELPKIVTTQSGDVMTMTSLDHPVIELRRLSPSKWELVEPDFVAEVLPPDVVTGSSVRGEGMKVTETKIGGHDGRDYLVTSDDHGFTHGTPLYVDGLPTSGAGSLAAGYYIAGSDSGIGNQIRHIYLHDVDSSTPVTHGGAATGLDGRVRYASALGEELEQKYVVTAIDRNNEESAASSALTLTNELTVDGSSNTVSWIASSGAVRYRVYKEISGLYGLIGETDELTFKDDNIGPDLGVSPPIRDLSLRRQSKVTFSGDTISWPNHGLTAGMPVIFRTTDQLPSVNEDETYYVVNPSDDEFQVALDPDADSPVVISGSDIGVHIAVSGHFPSTATYFEGRRVFGGSLVLPQDLWMTASGTESDLSYSIPIVDSDRIYFRVASREFSSIRHLIPLSQLVLLCDSTEYRLTPVNDDVLTPSSISVRPQSFVGADFPPPSLVNNTVVFAAARGGHVRELAYSRDVLGYLTGDLSIRASHLFDGLTIKDQAYAKAPLPVVWCVSSSGKLLGITYIPEENVGAWHQHTTPAAGVFESVAVVPEGVEDAVYVVVKRTINGQTKRYVERLANEFRGDTADLPDAFFVDSGLSYSGAATTTIAGLDHLEGETVSYLADGVAGTGVVTSGVLTLTTPASKVHVGLGFTTTIKTLPLSMMKVDAFGTGRQKNINQVWVRIFQSGAFKAGPSATDLRPSLSPGAAKLADDLVQVTLPASWDDDGQIFVEQDTPLPLTVAGLTIEVASGG